MDQHIERILNQVPGWNVAGAVVAPLVGGITNQNYRVDIDGETFVLRIGGKGTHLLGINFIDDGHTIRILDWEYAGMGDLFFDLGNFAVNQSLNEEQCALLLRNYFGGVRPADLAHLHLMRLGSDLRESFWGFLQIGISERDFDDIEYSD